ncbi:hypothetical protein B2J88_33035 [Rhodococcus sp. SRB_17]|nr:hypothetical protein [Rhodococcus sp. SRB_17]
MSPDSPVEHLVLSGRSGHVLTLTLNRPERLNATTPPMRQRLFTLLKEADDDPDVRCIVVTGTGRGFWPGEDRDELAKINGGIIADRSEPLTYDLPMAMKTPIVVAINGAVAGVGLSFVLQADIRVAASGAKWAAPFAGLGLVAEAGLSWLLQRHVGWGAALEILLTAEPFSSEDAYRLGIVQHLEKPDDVLPVANRIASRIARNSPFSIQNIREQIHLDATRGWEEAYADGSRRALESLDRADFHRAVAAAIEKREVTF